MIHKNWFGIGRIHSIPHSDVAPKNRGKLFVAGLEHRTSLTPGPQIHSVVLGISINVDVLHLFNSQFY